MRNHLRHALRLVGLTGLALVLSGCVSIYRNHGYVPPQEQLDEIVLGVDTRDSVDELVGPPTATGVLRDSGYYYVASKVRHYGASEPKLVERQLVAISFSEDGVVQGIERYGLEDGRAIRLERRVTENEAVSNNFLRQLLGNLGQFNPGALLNDE